MTDHIDKAKAALESCDGWPVNGTTDMALLAIANALVAIAEQGVESTLECIEDKSRWHQMFGTPERAARTSWYMLMCKHVDCGECPIKDGCDIATDIYCDDGEAALLEWLRGEA